jgi:hypothetical protein
MVGTSNQFTSGDFALTSIALLGGAWSGSISVILGTIAAYGVRPPVFFGLDFLPAVVNVAIASLLLAGRRSIARGLYLVLFFAFVLSPYSLSFGYGYVPYTWLHIVALAVTVSPLARKVPAWIKGGAFQQGAAVVFLAFVGTMAQHLAGGLLFEFVVGFVGGLSPSKFWELWRIIFWLYPVERTIITAISTLIAVPVYRSVRRLGS